MATVNFCGFETGDVSEGTASASGGSSATTTAAAARLDTYGFDANAVTTGIAVFQLATPTANGSSAGASIATSFVRFYINPVTLPSSLTEEFFIVQSGAGSKFYLRFNSSGNILAYDAFLTLLATGTTALATGQWYRIEVKCGVGSSTAPWEVKINGTSEISGTANLLVNNASSIKLGKSNNRNGLSVRYKFDDIRWDDAAYPGDGRITALLPNANGNYQTWTIGAGSGSNYQQVNERPPDSDTTYLLSPLIVNDLETEALTDSGTAGITGAVNTVKSVAIVKQNVSGGTVRVVLRSGSTDDVTSSDYTSTSAYVALSKLYDTDPATSAAWLVAALDSVEAGAKDTSAVNQVRMTFCAALVDWTPAQPRRPLQPFPQQEDMAYLEDL